jgi:hypothetical protein
VNEPSAVASPDAAVSAEFAELASEAIGVADDIERSGRYQPLRLRLYRVPSGVNNILIVNKVMTPGRVTAIIVNERLGF